MPLYQYTCECCGPFEGWRATQEAGQPGRCPVCAEPAPRTLAASAIFGAAAARRAQSAARAEPRLVTRPAPTPLTGTPRAPRGHGRPWMLGH
jgi:putative FmdB family regulatory protein